jgi:hypothetical protein
VSRAVKNANQLKGMAKLEVSGWRSLLQYPLGMVCKRQCNWAFGDQNCCVDLTPLRETTTLTIVDRNVISAAGLTLPRLHYWTFGCVTFDGLTIDITDGHTRTAMRLKEAPPPEWDGEDVEFTPGCGKELQNCREWDNELRFSGSGLKVLPYNPVTGDPGIGTQV